MLIIHAASLAGKLHLWAEDTDPTEPALDGSHPHGATTSAIATAIGITPEPTGAAATVWLPSRGNQPLPSEALAGPTAKGRAKPRLQPWHVPVLPLDTATAMALLQRGQNTRVLTPGIILGHDVAYWQHAMRFAAALTVRQQYLPNVAQHDGAVTATWTPLYLGEDAQRLTALAHAMPASARAMTDTSTAQPTATAPAAILKEFLASVVNHLARQQHQQDDTPEFDSAHDAWMYALTAPAGRVKASKAQLQQLQRQVREWHQPIAVSANSPYRLCLRLEEPPDPDPDQPTEKPTSTDWRLRYLLQPHDDHSLLLPANTAAQQTSPDFNTTEFLLVALAQAGAICPPVADSMKRRQPASARLDSHQAHEFLTQQAAALQQAGFGVMLPAWWTRQGGKIRPTIHAEARTPPMQGGANMTMTSLIDLNIQVAIGDQPIDAAELMALADLKVPLVRFRGQWVEIDANQIQAAADYWRRHDRISLRDAIRIGLDIDQQAHDDHVTLDTTGWLDDLMAALQQKSRIQLLDPPHGFGGDLRPYQRLGFSWLDFLRHWGFGACLADDMGLGKTVQTLAAFMRDREQGNRQPNLLVCPTSVINNWLREAERFTPNLSVMLHHGPSRPRGDVFTQQAGDHDLVVTSYGAMVRDQETLATVNWRSVTLDEAQNIKNPVTRQAQAARALPADYRIALTGTPVENHVGDLWSIMQFLNPGLLGTQAEFKRNYFTPIQTEGDADAASRLQQATGPFILRRLKTDPDIIDDLPDKRETKQYCNLTREQVTLYQAVLREVETRLEDAAGMERRGSILDTLMKLKQVCNHPRQLLGDNSAINGRSGKLARLVELLDEILPAGDRVLIFSQFVEMGAIIQQHVQETYGVETPMLHGGLSRPQRDRLVDRFQNDPNGPPALMLSLKAGGAGLNLYRANHVIHYDRWWNPAVENQATDRAFRIGQTKDVHVHKLICAGTLEDRIDLMIETKQQTAERVVGATTERWLTELSNEELRDVLALSATPED